MILLGVVSTWSCAMFQAGEQSKLVVSQFKSSTRLCAVYRMPVGEHLSRAMLDVIAGREYGSPERAALLRQAQEAIKRVEEIDRKESS